MTISYKWLSEYLPADIEPERLSRILTSIGLEVEKMEIFEEVRGGLKGLVVGEVIEANAHPNADKLKLTRVNLGNGEPLQIVCGAPNVAAGQKVIVATVGTTIYPVSGDPLTMKIAKIRGIESYGMICAEDEIGIGHSHAGIMVLPSDTPTGMSASEYFTPYNDIIFEIGLTPNRMDAMSHWGVARDVCAYLSHHDKKDLRPVYPAINFKVDNHSLKIRVDIENNEACRRYSGICLSDITVKESPKWLKDRLQSIGLRPINNIVDITNFIQHETGQPLHAFDYDQINGKHVIVKTMADGTLFTTLDEKERKLHREDLMICDEKETMCIAGVFGGIHSGVTEKTKNVFLESAWFDPVYIRKTSFRHGLRTDAATRFEKGIDISNTVNILKRAAVMISEITGGKISSDIIDIYPDPVPKEKVSLKYHYLKKLSGKNYHPDAVKKILESLGFTLERDSMDAITVSVPYHKPDISIPADVVEEILRIDGLDSIDIPTTISISPSIDVNYKYGQLKEKVSNILMGLGYSEILTNSITNSKYFSEEENTGIVKLLNNLSSELDVMRPSMLHTALEVISFNINRKNNDLRMFEFGKTYSTTGPGEYNEADHLCIYLTGQLNEMNWKEKAKNADFFHLKGIVTSLFNVLGINADLKETNNDPLFQDGLIANLNGEVIMKAGMVKPSLAAKFDIRQAVFFADLNWNALSRYADTAVRFREIPRYPSVERDLALVVPRSMQYGEIREKIEKLRIEKIRQIRLFDVFESEKLGNEKKSLAINFTFQDESKTLTDKEIDGWMNRIMTTLEKDLNAEIRK